MLVIVQITQQPCGRPLWPLSLFLGHSVSPTHIGAQDDDSGNGVTLETLIYIAAVFMVAIGGYLAFQSEETVRDRSARRVAVREYRSRNRVITDADYWTIPAIIFAIFFMLWAVFH